jgi:alpha-galactosidase
MGAPARRRHPAVGLFNRGLLPYEITARFSDLGLSGEQPVRDLWRRRDLGAFTDGYTVEVPRHGAVMIRVGRPGGAGSPP